MEHRHRLVVIHDTAIYCLLRLLGRVWRQLQAMLEPVATGTSRVLNVLAELKILARREMNTYVKRRCRWGMDATDGSRQAREGKKEQTNGCKLLTIDIM